MIRTIIVDDEILSRIGLRSFLDGKEGIVVSGIFGEAAEAIKFLEENVIDIVLTDIEMSDMNGLEFIQHIREQHLASGVIIVSCHDDFSYAQQAISLGTDSYILKHSVTEEKLISEVKKVYEKVLHAGQEKKHIRGDYHESTEIKEKCIYRVGVLKIDSREHLTIHSNQQAERDMLVHLLEEIVARYQMGTLFAPYNREIFVSFDLTPRFEKYPYDLNYVKYGSLVFALPIEAEKIMYEYEKDGVERKFPYCDYELSPQREWNRGFASDVFEVIEKPGDAIPFSSKAPRIMLKTKLAPVKWEFADGYDSVADKTPVSNRAIGETEDVELIPYGCAKLRMTEMPKVK